MELRVSAREPGMSLSVYKSDHGDKEISDDDDNDRNHKHRRRQNSRSQSLEDDVTGRVFSKPYRRGRKPFQNGNLYWETGSQSNETWKYSFNPLEKEISGKFDQQRGGFSQFSRGPLDLNLKSRGRDFSHWSQLDPKFSSVNIASQMVQQGSTPHGLFSGRALPKVSNSHGPSWSPFGLVPGIPNGALEMLHPLGLRGTFKQPINSSLDMGLARQRCRDFEEQGFCLRGDMCPMEHGMNRIVVEDVQSLSQFNLPVSLASANLSISPVGAGPSSTIHTLSNSKGSHGKNVKCGISDNGLDISGTFIDSASAADFYDPDQPLWGCDSHILTGPQSLSQPKNGSLFDHGLAGDHHAGLSDDTFDNEPVTTVKAVGSLKTRSSVWGRINSETITEMRENIISKASPSKFMHVEKTEAPVPSSSTQDSSYQKKQSNADSSLKMQSGNRRMTRKPSQKAQRTLFVTGIPQQNNKRESLLPHFHKFGEVINIYIPLNSERAFVQFSKSAEAEAALMAPDAVMGNRFIKLWWANRDNIHDNGTKSDHNMSVPPRGLIVPLVSPNNFVSVANKIKDDSRLILHKGVTTPLAIVSASDQPKPVGVNGTKVLQRKLENLEVLKEKLRKKQEMLDQKRNDFRRKLDKLEKQATGLKGEIPPEHLVKRLKLEVLADSTKAATPNAGDCDTVLPSAQDEVVAASRKSMDPAGPQCSKTALGLAHQESSTLKSSPLPSVHVSSAVNNRFKLDNRPTTFEIVPPLPDGLADVHVLKEHFSQYGDLSNVQLEPIEGSIDPRTSKVSARIYFKTRRAAEKAFLSGKSWKGHNLQFAWLNSSNNRKDTVARETPTPTSKPNLISPRTNCQTAQTPSASGDGESEKAKETEVVKDHTEADKSH